MTKNGHAYAIFCQSEVAGGGIYGGSVKAVDGYKPINLELLAPVAVDIVKKIILNG